MLRNARTIIFILCFINLLSAWNAEGDELDMQTSDQEQDKLGLGIARMIASLMAILALIALGVFLLKKITPYRGMMSGGERPISILSKAPLGQRRAIYIVKVADEILVLGLTNASISLLTKIDADDYYAQQGAALHEGSNDYANSFRSILGRFGIGNNRTSAAHEEQT